MPICAAFGYHDAIKHHIDGHVTLVLTSSSVLLTIGVTRCQIREGLDWDQAVKELLQTVEYLRSTGSTKVNSFAAIPYNETQQTLCRTFNSNNSQLWVRHSWQQSNCQSSKHPS